MNNTDRQYAGAIAHIMENGRDKTDRTGTGTRSVFGHQMRFDLAEGFPLVTLKKTNFKAVAHELLWFIGAFDSQYDRFGNTNIRYLVDHGVGIWSEWPHQAYLKKGGTLDLAGFVQNIREDDSFALRHGELGPVYGKQWTKWQTREGVSINQLQGAVDTLRSNPDSRRIIVSAWNPEDIGRMMLPPCHAFFQFITEPATESETANAIGKGKTIGDSRYRLSLQLYQRSCDTFLGVPFNIASYALLLEMVAQCTGMVPGDFVWTGGDMHLYNNHLDVAREVAARPNIYQLPEIRLNPDITELSGFRYGDIRLDGYVSHPAVRAEVAV